MQLTFNFFLEKILKKNLRKDENLLLVRNNVFQKIDQKNKYKSESVVNILEDKLLTIYIKSTKIYRPTI